MITYEEAIKIILKSAGARTLPSLVLPIEDSLGFIVKEAVSATESVPSFDNSAMDGFAICSRLTEGVSAKNPIRFRVLSCIAAGDGGGRSESSFTGGAHVAHEIMTGAMMPGGDFDSVVKIEDVLVERDSSGKAIEIAVAAPLHSGTHVRKKGEDFKEGMPVLNGGDGMTPEKILAATSLGIAKLNVYRKIKVAVLSTGLELVHHSVEKLTPGMIRNSTAPFLMSALKQMGAEPHFYGTIKDDPVEFERTLLRILAENPDVILTTGAVSMGIFDFVEKVLRKMKAEILFHKVAIRPGKPLLFAEMSEGGPVLFGVPGNPVSTAVGLRFFVEPYLRALNRRKSESSLKFPLLNKTSKPKGLRCFFKARIASSLESSHVEILSGQASFMVSPLLQANAWVELSEEGSELEVGTPVEVYPIF